MVGRRNATTTGSRDLSKGNTPNPTNPSEAGFGSPSLNVGKNCNWGGALASRKVSQRDANWELIVRLQHLLDDVSDRRLFNTVWRWKPRCETVETRNDPWDGTGYVTDAVANGNAFFINEISEKVQKPDRDTDESKRQPGKLQ